MEVGHQRHAPAALPPGKIRYQIFRRLWGPESRSGRVRKISAPSGFDPRTFQPVASQVLITNAEVLAEQHYRVCMVTQHARTHRAMFSVTFWVLTRTGHCWQHFTCHIPTFDALCINRHAPILVSMYVGPGACCMWLAQQILPFQGTCYCTHLHVVPVYAACVAKNSPR